MGGATSVFNVILYCGLLTRGARDATLDPRLGPNERSWLALVVEPDHPERQAPWAEQLGVYSGSAGVILFLLQLGKATGDRSYFKTRQERRRLSRPSLAGCRRSAFGGPPRSPFSFYNGLSGIGFSLTETWKATGEAAYRDAALASNHYLVQAAKPTAVGDTWTGTPSLGSGDTGVLLYLLYAASAFQNDSYRKLAERAGENILSLAQPDKRGRVRWIGVPGASLPGMPADTYFPDFELGTAGVSYGLARLYSETNNLRFLEPQSRARFTSKRSQR